MSIPDELKESKGRALLGHFKRNIHQLYVPFVLILIGITSFSLGRLSISSQNQEGVRIVNQGAEIKTNTAKVLDSVNIEEESVVASKNGTVYYLPWCSGVSRIKPENLVHFSSAIEARKQGYLPSSTCKGIK